MNRQNRKRGLADVVGVEAWHRPFTGKCREAPLHIDVVFQTGRFGANPSAPVRFTLSIKRAEVVVIRPENEPVRVQTQSVVRDAPNVRGKAVKRAASSLKGKAKARLKAGPDGVAAGVDVGVGAAKSVDETTETVTEFKAIQVVHMRDADEHHRWILTPAPDATLQGRPWDSDEPRLTLQDTRQNRDKGLEPTVHVAVRCRRDDLEISNLAMKNETTWEKVKSLSGFPNRRAAAEALIRTELFEEGLIRHDADLSDGYLEMTLALTTAES